jgi:enoyl-CoA hydratase/carnithine racemase
MKTQRAISHSNKVVIAEGKGYIVGVALELFLCADILICAEGTRMFYPPARMAGVSNDTLFWILRMGPTLSAEMTFMGRTITAEEALERDMINRVVPLDQLEATVRAAADAVCCIPADGLAIAKYNRKAAFEILGRGADKFNSVLGHAMQMTIKLEEGEWNLNKERQEYGTKEAWRRRDARFEEALNRYKPEN